MVNMVDFQNTPQNGDRGHDNDKHLAGGQGCSRFVPVHGLFSFCSRRVQNWNKAWTKGERPMVWQNCNTVV